MENTENQTNGSASASVENVNAETKAQQPETAKKTDWKKTAIILAVLLIAAFAVLGYYVWQQNGSSSGKNAPALTAQDASKAVMDYINKYYPEDGKQASVSAIKDEKIDGVYQFTLKMNGQEDKVYVSSDGKMLFPTMIDLTMSPEEAAAKAQAEAEAKYSAGKTDGNFTELSDVQTCQENGKPIVYLFGSEQCPHCKWEKPVMEAVAQKFGSAISFHENITQTLGEQFANDQDVFNSYLEKGYIEGGVPTIIIGCKYYREGAGESAGAESETAALTKLICNLTGNQPGEVCGQ